MRTAAFAAVATIAAIAGSAAGSTILSFGFTDLSGSFDTSTGTFLAVGVDTAILKTGGNVNRHLSPVGTAAYAAGSADGLVSISMAVSSIMGSTANGSGSLFIEDADGDRLVATIDGTFTFLNPAVAFAGTLTGVAFVPGSGTNNMFDGPSGGSIPLTFAPAQPPITGALVQLHFETGSTFFGQNFQGQATGLNGAVIPAPGALALLGVGGLFAMRRRRTH
jgi:hypothetical protein